MLNVPVKSIIIALIIITSNAFATDKVLWEEGPNQKILIRTATISDTVHPISISKQTLTGLLTNMYTLNKKGELENAVFNDQQVTLLAKYISQGLSEINNNEALYFTVAKDKSTMGGLLKSEVFTAGTIFHTENGVTIAIGDHERERDYSYEAVFDPNKKGLVKYDFNYGFPASKSNKTALTLNPEKVRTGSFVADNNLISIPVSDLTSLVTQKDSLSNIPPSDVVSRNEVEKMLEDTRGLSKQEVQDIVRETKVEQSSPKAQSTTKTIEERFQILENLKAKGLITDQEYQQKRQELLSEL